MGVLDNCPAQMGVLDNCPAQMGVLDNCPAQMGVLDDCPVQMGVSDNYPGQADVSLIAHIPIMINHCLAKLFALNLDVLLCILELCARILKNMHIHLNGFFYLQNIHEMCLFVKLKLHQNQMRRNDFIFHMKSLKSLLLVENKCYLWILLLSHLLDLFLMAMYVFMIKNSSSWYLDLHAFQNENVAVETKTVFIGGGNMNTFSRDEIGSYILNYYPMNSIRFRFHSYMLKHEALALCSPNSPYLLVDLPLPLLLPKLTVFQLKLVAAAHGLNVYSKEKSAVIKSAISDHMCISCSSYVSTFEPLDD